VETSTSTAKALGDAETPPRVGAVRRQVAYWGTNMPIAGFELRAAAMPG